MRLIPGNTGFSAPFVVHTIDPSSWGGEAKVKRFLGCAFPCASTGVLATCNHVINEIFEDEMLVVWHLTETVCYKANILAQHNKFDIAFLKIEAKTPLWAFPILDELPLGTIVDSYGYYDTCIENQILEIIPQMFTGTITATPTKNFGLQTGLPFYQISFPALPGFSGSPLYADYEKGSALCGMIFENRSSKIVVRTIEEYKDGKTHFIEKSVREWESGVAHTTKTINSAAEDFGIKIWQ
ncbi:MAG: serine protease [Burkholderiales bacterium]|nr:serine protease [Burkholderiales bacterium]